MGGLFDARQQVRSRSHWKVWDRRSYVSNVTMAVYTLRLVSLCCFFGAFEARRLRRDPPRFLSSLGRRRLDSSTRQSMAVRASAKAILGAHLRHHAKRVYTRFEDLNHAVHADIIAHGDAYEVVTALKDTRDFYISRA